MFGLEIKVVNGVYGFISSGKAFLWLT